MPSFLKEAIAVDMVYPIVPLAHDWSLGLLPAMDCNLLNGLRELHTELTKVETIVNGEGETTYKTPNPQVELLHMYLMACLVLHCSSLMTALTSEDLTSLPYVQWSENSAYTRYYMSAICRALQSYQNYHIYHSFSKFLDSNCTYSF